MIALYFYGDPVDQWFEHAALEEWAAQQQEPFQRYTLLSTLEEDIDYGKITIVATYSLSDFGKTFANLTRWLELLKDRGVRVVTLLPEFDTGSQEGQEFLHYAKIIAQVSKALRKAHTPKRKVTPTIEERIVRLYKDGFSGEAIAPLVKLSHQTCYRVLRKAGLL